MADVTDVDNHIDDAKGLVEAVRFVGGSLDDNSMARDGIEALCRFDPELCARLGH